MQVLRFGYRVPFCSRPPLSPVPLLFPSYSTESILGLALADAVSDLVAKETIELAPPSPGFYSRLFVTPKVTGGWCPVIDLSLLNGWVKVSHFTWRLPRPLSNLSGWGIGWYPWISRMPTCRFRCIHLAGTRGFAWGSRSTGFAPSVSSCRWLLRRSPASWRLSPRSCIITGSGSFGTLTIGWSWLPPFRRLCV